MALDAATAQEMLKKLADDRASYLDTLENVLTHALAAVAAGKSQPPLTAERLRRDTNTTLATTTTAEVETVQKDLSFAIDDESDTDDDDSLFVQDTLPTEHYELEGLRKHIREYQWTESGRSILRDILRNEKVLGRKSLFPSAAGPVEDRSHLSHYSIFDVGDDGVPLPVLIASERTPTSRAVAIWNRISKINTDPDRQNKSVGRITIVREPSPLLFAAIHYTMRSHFDMDNLFELLERNNKTKALPHDPWSDTPKHRNTFVFTFDYYTVVGEDCQPMKWQKADEELGGSETHVPVSRCSSVVALALEGEPINKIRHKGRRIPLGRKEGEVYDPFSPWHVLSIQAYPDWRSTIHSHGSTKHYVNGPEAFLMTLRAEFKDAQKRLMDVYSRISDLITTPSEFMFKQAIRDKLLFEDDDFTYSRRYFWAYQSLAIMNEDIKEMITAYKETFKENVWNGTNKAWWPGAEDTARNVHWRKRMDGIRKDIDRELNGFSEINRLNDEKMKEIKGLRDNLFSGTSVLESRRSVQQQAITVIQGNNIKILTLVTIFFLPLTFVTSVFGMTNMNPNDNFIRFGIVTAAICLPVYMLIGSLNTESGFAFWTEKFRMPFTRAFWWRQFVSICSLSGYRPKSIAETNQSMKNSYQERPSHKPRSVSATEGIRARGGFGPSSPLPMSFSPTSERNCGPTIEPPKSVDLAKSPVLLFPDPKSSASLEATTKPKATESIQREVQGGWFSRSVAWRRESQVKGGDDAYA